ncbi:MAG: STAS domain-containing protein [Gammaproteobacteria bacterium]|nr:STAS domain-containing protein [Gammaproteobacteria bacterium]
MPECKIHVIEHGLVKIDGVLDLKTVNSLKKQTISLFNGPSEIQFDLSAVSQSNSAALALLLEWLKMAQKNQVSLTFCNFPEHLRELARVYGIEQDLNII